MSYVAPHLRDGAQRPAPVGRYGRKPLWEVQRDERIAAQKVADEKRDAELKEYSTTKFPLLDRSHQTGGNSARISYSGKADSWTTQKLHDEDAKRQADAAEQRRIERIQRSKEEDERLKASLPSMVFRKPTVIEQHETAQKQVEDEWTVVQKKPRKEPKSKINFDEVPEDMSESSEHDEWDDYADKDSLWK